MIVRNSNYDVQNANTVDAGLQRSQILTATMRAFKRRLINLNAFSTVYQTVTLAGNGKVAVPFLDLHTVTSTNFVQANGYQFNGNSATSSREITVNKRKYQPFNYSSEEFRRQPFFKQLEQMTLRGEQLANDVFADILSAVTAANFGAAVKTEPAAAFDHDDIVDIGVACEQSDWPQTGCSILLDSAYAGNVLKGLAPIALQGGNEEPLRKGSVGRISEFDIFKSPRIPSNGEGLKGMAVHPSGLLVAFSPITPAPRVMKQLVAYEQISDEETGITFEYRHWGVAQADSDYEVIECNYGFEIGNVAGIKRITSGE